MEATPAPPVEAAATPGASTLTCHGPLQVPEEALSAGGDAELAVTPPTLDDLFRAEYEVEA